MRNRYWLAVGCVVLSGTSLAQDADGADSEERSKPRRKFA